MYKLNALFNVLIFYLYIYKTKYAIYIFFFFTLYVFYILINQGMTHAGPNFIFYIVYYIILTLF